MIKRQLSRLYIKIINKDHLRIGKNTNVSRKSEFEGSNYIGCNSTFNGRLGYASYIGDECDISAAVGRYTSIAAKVRTINGFHPTGKYVSTHPAFYNDNCTGVLYHKSSDVQEYKYADESLKADVIIGNDVWIGYGVTLFAGVEIGDGAIIGAGSLVTKNIPPYCIVGGVPAHIIRYRFDKNTIELLLKYKWWNKQPQWLMEHGEYFTDIDRLMAIISQGEKIEK